MPAHLRGADPDGGDDLLGIKWIAGFPANRARGLPAIHGLVLLNDPTTGVPTAILDAGPITAERTAAISGVAIAPVRAGRRRAGRRASRSSAPASRAGATCRSSGTSCRASSSRLRSPSRSGGGARRRWPRGRHGHRRRARGRRPPGTRPATPTWSSPPPRSPRPTERQTLTDDWLTPDALVVAVDYATYVRRRGRPRGAALFLVDQREQFLANRDAGQLRRLPGSGGDDRRGDPRGHDPAGAGRVLVTHLGVGLADLVFGDAILRRATRRRGSGRRCRADHVRRAEARRGATRRARRVGR